MDEELFDEMKRYVGFGGDDEALLRDAGPLLEPHFARVVDDFYGRVERHPGALAVIREGQAQVDRLKKTLIRWLREFFEGPWDQAYFEHRERIGRMHVRIQLPQQYNFTAMNVIRGHLTDLVARLTPDSSLAARRVRAIDRLMDLELAIVLHTYREDYDSQLQRTERLATFGQMTSTIGHELRNPLGVIESSVYLLRRRVGEDPAVVRHLDKIQGQVARSNRIIGSMLDIVRDRPPNRGRVLPVVAADRAVADVLERRGFGVELVAEAKVAPVLVDPQQLHQVLVNLLDNAVDAIGGEGRVRVRVGAAGASRVALVVSDSGPGIHPDVRARLFEPLVTTKDAGVGLGLALCRKLVDAAGGTLDVVSPGQDDLPGAVFRVTLERAPE
ncbi:MAG: protoglobin domain-containing protein [Myxococcales bacterium]|jgi:signal transduction histidine kinase